MAANKLVHKDTLNSRVGQCALAPRWPRSRQALDTLITAALRQGAQASSPAKGAWERLKRRVQMMSRP